MSDLSVICLTPVRNEAWILERFLQCASLWADHIILADQQSDDGSRELAARFPKVRLIDNPGQGYNEVARQQLLINEARTIPGPRLLIALDADEIFTPNVVDGPEWQTIRTLAPGTVVRFPWANIRPGFRTYWQAPHQMPFGFMDDGSAHTGEAIHSVRIPMRPDAPVFEARAVQVMHLQYVDWERMESKHRWYQCWERLTYPDKSAIRIFRRYCHMYAVPPGAVRPIPAEWLSAYQERGIDLTDLPHFPYYRWDEAVLDYLTEHGPDRFAREMIWSVDWAEKARRMNRRSAPNVVDPRGLAQKALHTYLTRTRAHFRQLPVRVVDKLLSTII